MHRFYHILCAVLVLLLLTIGSISVFDRDATLSRIQDRELKSFPKFSLSGYISGSFQEELDAYYADTFPGRESLLEQDGIISSLFDFSDLDIEDKP